MKLNQFALINAISGILLPDVIVIAIITVNICKKFIICRIIVRKWMLFGSRLHPSLEILLHNVTHARTPLIWRPLLLSSRKKFFLITLMIIFKYRREIRTLINLTFALKY